MKKNVCASILAFCAVPILCSACASPEQLTGASAPAEASVASSGSVPSSGGLIVSSGSMSVSDDAVSSSISASLSSASAASFADTSVQADPYLFELFETYIKPLGLTTIIGSPWSTPAEIAPDDVLVTMEIMVYYNRELEKKYISKDNQYLIFPRADAEAYAAQYFGMTRDQLEKSSCYDAETQSYVVMMGLGGAWDVVVTGGENTDDLLRVHYNLINAMGEVDGTGVMTIQLKQDGSYQYLSNEQEPGAWEKSNAED